MNPKILAHFREQAMFCAEYGSPFTAQLLECMAADIEAGGPVAELVRGWPSDPRADALSLRIAGALHAAVLTGRDGNLARVYSGAREPSPLAGEGREGGRANTRAPDASARPPPPTPAPQGGGDVNFSDIWPVARAFLEREHEWVREFIKSPPQTNETRRSIALLAGFLAAANDWNGPIDMLEIGASAGLNLYWDRFFYRTSSWTWGEPSAVVIDTDWHGAPPPLVRVNVRHRAACDLNPLDVRDEVARLRLRSYIWPDQRERLARFDGAVTLALEQGVQVERADAAEWLREKLAARADDAATIVYHSVFLQYPPREAREAIVAAMHAAGARATAKAPLAWVRLELEAVTDGVENGLRFVIDLHTWPGGERRILGYTDGHVRAVYAL